MSYSGFKSGTDIRGFGTEDFSSEKLYLSDEFVSSCANAFCVLLSEKLDKKINLLKISLGRDSRVSGPRIMKALAASLTSLGVNVIDCNLASTPAMFMSVLDLACDGAVQITASHHPSERNGLKFFTSDGGLDGNDIEFILDYAFTHPYFSSEINNQFYHIKDYMSDYSLRLRNLIINTVGRGSFPLKGLKIIVDAGNGVGGFYATEVLEKLGADISGSQFLNPDGTFPNHIPNPENSVAMSFISKATVTNNADLGIIFDTDVDRAACVDSEGNEINRNRLVALASYLAIGDKKNCTIVTDSVTSDGLKDFITALGGSHYRYKRGYKNVINKQIELNNKGINCPLAIETSGHAAFKENYYLDDGAYLMTRIVILLAEKGKNAVSEILKPLRMPCDEKELRFNINSDDFKKYGMEVIQRLETYYEGRNGYTIADDNREGMRISCDKDHGDGWMLLRLSVHDPVMPFNIESNSEGGCKIIASSFFDFISDFKDLDITPIIEYLEH